MARNSIQPVKRTRSTTHAPRILSVWKLEDAKAKFSEVVRLAASDGPQLVTIRGKRAAVILAAEEYEQLQPKPKDHLPLVQFLQSLDLDEVDLVREHDTGRELVL